MRNIHLLLCLLISWLPLSAQLDDGWVEAGNAAYNSSLISVEFLSDDVGFAVGAGGAFLKTTNGGLSWTAYHTGYPYFFREIFFLDNNLGFLVGNRYEENHGRLLKTTDGGATWVEIFGINDNMFFTVYFYNASVGYVGSSGIFYKTLDGGLSWLSNSSINSQIRSFYFKDLNNGFMAAALNGTPAGGYKTSNGGGTWTEFEPETCEQVFFVDNNTGYLVRSNISTLKKTTDGGQTWTETGNTQMSGGMKKVSFKDALNGIALGNANGHIARTTDGGASWTLVQNQMDFKIYGISHKPNGDYYAVGQSGRIRKSVNNGAAWTQVTMGVLHHRLNDVCFLNDSTLVGVGNAGLLVKSIDRGTSWTNLNSGQTADLLGIWAVSPSTLFIVGTQNTLLKSVNGGTTWQSSNTGFTSGAESFGDIRFLNATTGFAGVEKLYKTVNGGASWSLVLTPAQAPLYDMAFPTSDTLYARSKYYVYRSVDGGNGWSPVAQNLNQWHCGIDFLDRNTGITGKNYDVVKTTDAGANWTDSYLDNIGRVSDVKMKSPISWTAIGWDGMLENTEDGGATWEQVNSQTTRDLYVLTYGPDGTGYILGDEGLLLRKAVVPTYTLTFNLFTALGDPISGASITLNGTPYPAGVYAFPGLLAGVYSWTVSAPGFCPESGSSNVSANVTEVVIMGECYEVLVEVKNVFGQPVEGAEVMLGGESKLTSSGGTASFFSGSGNASLEVVAAGYKTYSNTISIQSDIILPITLAADLDAPAANAATDIADHSFVANWQSPSNADSCLLYVSDDNFTTYLPGYEGLGFAGNQAEVVGLEKGTVYSYRLKAKNEYGLSDYSNAIEVTTTTTAVDEPASAPLKLYPNPADNWLVLEAPGAGQAVVEIVNLQGLVVLRVEATLPRVVRMDVSGLQSGVYVVRLGERACYFIKL